MEALGPAAIIGSTVTSLIGSAAGAQQDKYNLEAQERTAEIQRSQTESNALAQLRNNIANIRAVRASSGALNDSPTAIAIADSERKVADINRSRQAFGYQNAANMASADRSLVDDFMWLQMGGTIFKGMGQLAGAY